MKTFKYLTIAIVAICLASCGGKNSSGSDNSFDVTIDNTTIDGKLSQYFSLEDKTYKYQKGIIDEVNAIKDFAEIKTMSKEEAVEKGLYNSIGK